VGLAALGIAAWSIGATIGLSPGGEIASIARRLDAFGHDTRHAEHAPIVSSSADAVGDLLRGLEELRVRLDAEIALYQDALDRTRAADALKADFLSAVSHELRTPLNTVGGYAQLLLDGVPSPMSSAQAEDVRLIKAGGERLLELINDILDVSMIESGELRLAFASVPLDEIIHEVILLHQPLVRDRDVELLTEIGPDLPEVVCDRRRIGQIVTNLVSNAIKFTESGSITVRASFDPRRGEVVVRTIDTGVGIAPEEIDLIFEEYRQVGAAARRKKGTGLGLAIARTIARYHGGTLTVESTLGRGSIFTLTLPLEPPKLAESIDIAEEAARSRMRAQQRGGTWSGWSVEAEP
jgi:signal transduction histidine kinase